MSVFIVSKINQVLISSCFYFSTKYYIFIDEFKNWSASCGTGVGVSHRECEIPTISEVLLYEPLGSYHCHSSFSRQGNLTHFCQIIWQIWSYTAQNKFCQKLSPVGFDHLSNTLLTVLGRNLLETPEVGFLLFHAPLHMLDFVYFWNQ